MLQAMKIICAGQVVGEVDFLRLTGDCQKKTAHFGQFLFS